MGNVFTLDSLREELENEYKPVQIPLSDGTEAVLPSLLRLPKAVRKEVHKVLKDVDKLQDTKADDIDAMEALVLKVIRLVAGHHGPKLIEDLGDDLTLTLRVFSKWMGGSQPGEASASAS